MAAVNIPMRNLQRYDAVKKDLFETY